MKGTVVFAAAAPSGLRQSQRVAVRLLFETKTGVLKLPRGPFLESGAGRSAWVVDASGVATRRDDRDRRRQRLGGRGRATA